MSGSSSELFTPETLGTYAGLSAAVIVVTNVLANVLKLKQKPGWLGLLVSLVICIAVAFMRPQRPGPADLFIAALNAFLVYATAVGGNAIAIGVDASSRAVKGRNRGLAPSAETAVRHTFFREWI